MTDARAYSVPLKRTGEDNYIRRESSPDDRLYKVSVAWDKHLVSDAGAHYHFFLPTYLESFSSEAVNKILNECEYNAKCHGDPVSFSFEFIQPQWRET